MTIGEKIKHIRLLKNMTQKVLGEVTGIGEATIRKYELGIRNPKLEQLKKIANAFQIDLINLLELSSTTIKCHECAKRNTADCPLAICSCERSNSVYTTMRGDDFFCGDAALQLPHDKE